MDQHQLILNNKDGQELLEPIFQEILDEILREEEDIQNELDPILEILDLEDKLTTLTYIRKIFPNFSFWKAQKYQFEEFSENQDYHTIVYKVMKNNKMDQTNFINLLQNKEFCNQNNIPECLQNKEILGIIQKLQDKLFSLFELNELILSQKQYSQDMIKYLLQLLYMQNNLTEIEQNQLEQTIGNLLSPKIFEFQEFTESVLKDNTQYVTLVIQNIQLQNKNQEDSIKDEKLNQKQYLYLKLMSQQKVRKSIIDLNKDLCDLLQMNINQFQQKETIYQMLQYKIDYLAFKNLSLYEICYFQILFYFWIQYFNKLNLQNEIKQLEEDLKKVRQDRQQATINRYLNKFKKLTNDELHLFIIHQLIYFDPMICINKQKFDVFKAKQDDELKIAKQYVSQSAKTLLESNQQYFSVTLSAIQNLSISNILNLIQTNTESYFYHFLFFFKKIDYQKQYNLLKNLFREEKQTQIVLQNLIKQGSFLKVNEIIVLLNLIGKQNQIEENKLYKYRISYYIFKNFKLIEQIGYIDSIINYKQSQTNLTQTLDLLDNVSLQELKAIKLLNCNENLKQICSDFLDIYLTSQHENKKLFNTLLKIIPIVNPGEIQSLRIFQIMLKILRPQSPKIKKIVPRIKLRSINQRLLESIMQFNSSQIYMPTLKTFIHTLYILFLLFKKCNEKQLDYLLTNLNLIIRNKSYDYALIRQEMSYKTPIQLILKMLLIQFMYLQNNAVTFDEYFIHNQSLKQDKLCENLYYLDSQLYERWLSPINYYNEFRLTPSYFSKQKQQQLILKETKISLYDFSISFSVMTNYEQVELIKSWVQSMNDQQKFKQLIPFFFNIIKRGENPKKFIQLINKELELNQSLFKNGLNMKALFQIFYNNSDYELQVMLLKFQCQNYPVPLIFQNQDLSNIKNKEENYLLNEKLYYIFPECFPIINISLSENQTTIGKTELINKIFYEMDEFETLDTCELNRNTIDIMFDFSFCGSRQFCIADTHGFIPISILSKLVPLFKLWIIQLDSEKELLDTLNKIYELFYPFQKQKIPEICLVIRNSIENTRENFINNWKEKTKVSLKLNSKQSEIFNNINNVHCIIDLKSKNISKESKETAIEEFQNFIFEVTLKILNKDKKQYINQNNYLEIIKGFNTSYKQVSEQIESDGIIMANLEDELKKQIITENGFYSITSFPLRSIHWQINNSKEELDQLFSLKDEKNNKKITQIKDKIKELEEQIKSQKPTKLLNLFCDLFEKKNNYILYLSFIDKIRLFNEQNTYVIQDQIQVLIESIQKLKKEISSLKQSNDQNPTDEGLKKLIKMKDEMKKQNDKLLLLKKNREFKNIGIELFWRELIQMKQKCTQQELRINPVDVVFDMIKKGEPFEFLDGDQLKIDQMFLQQLTDKFSQSGNEKVLVLSVLGPQSSGKSTILNKIFGCHFWTSVGRCTKGIYLQLIRISQKQYFNNLFDYILILDSEGLQNPNQQNDEFNKKIALFILSISDIILINVKGDIHSQFKNLVEMCIFTLGQMNNALATIKQISWCFNQNNDVNFFSCFLHQIQGIANNLNQEFNKTSQESQHQSNQENENQTIDYNEVLDIRKENIQILGFASYERGWKNKEYGFEKIWRQLIKNQTFSEEAYQYGVRIIKNYVQKKQQSSNMPSLHSFIQNINQNWQTICRSPELLEFTELIQYKQDELMKKQFTIIYDRYDFNFKNNIQDDIKRYIEIQRDINMETFKQLQKEKEQAIIEQFSQIEDEIIIELQQIKKEQQISKKILVKYENRLKQQISTEIEECKMIIFNEIKEQETKLQKNKGFLQIDNYISSISENTTELKKLQQNDKLIGQNFEEIWKEISTNQMKQMEEIFEEFSLKQYKLIFERFSVYKLKSDMEKDYQKFFIDKINKNSPFQNQQIEKEQIVEIFKNELKSYQFEIFQEELSGKNEWNKLYYELYDITLMNMRSNQNKSQIFNNNKNDSDDEISSIDINLIQMIMSKITLTVNSYKKQFAKFGIILNHIGERCIYYYSMFLIWRFSCYNKWKMLKKNYDTLQQHKSEQFTKYKEAIKSNKVEQSQIKAQLFARIIYQTFIQEYYQKKKKDVINFIETKNKTCFDIIKEQDKRLLEQYQSNFTQKQKDEVMLYITDQKNFIENYANQTISNIKEEITKDHQNKLKQELLNYLFVIHYNVNLISTQLQTEQKQGLKTIDYFETQDNQKLVDYEFEQEMFKIVKACIFKEKYQNPYGKSIKDDYQEYFNISKFKELSSKINVIMPSPSDNEIQQLKPYIQELLKQITKYLDQSENERLNINNFQIEGTIDKIKFHMIGCRQSCPLCKRKCDKPIDYNNYNHKHQCQNGHQLRGMNFVLIDNKPSLFTCEEITDDMLITTQQTNKVRFWKEIKQIYNDWNFKTLILQNDVNHQKQVKDKMMNVWNGGIGQLICNVLSNKFNKTIAFITKHDLAKYEQDKSKVHYIFMLDDSYSMQGQAWNNAKNGVLTCMEEIEKNPNAKVSVIIFNSKARVAIDCEKVNIDSQYDKIMKSDELFFFRHCNIEIAFQLVFDQIQKYKNQQFERNLILFYTDGGYSYPAQAMDKLIQLPLDQKKNISLIACSEKSNPATLSLMVSNLKENGYVADLRVNIKLGNFQKVWSEIVLQGIHVSD